MNSDREDIAEEVLDIPTGGLPELDDGLIYFQDASKIPIEEQAELKSMMRRLARQMGMDVPPAPVDALELEEKLRNLTSAVPRSFSSPAATVQSSPRVTPSFTEEESAQQSLETDKRSYDALLAEGGVPSFPFEDREQALKRSGEHKNIVDYWLSEHNLNSIFYTQIDHWRQFRRYQMEIRQAFEDNWSDHQREVQDRRHSYNFETSCILEKNLDNQDQLTTWMEYQYYHHHIREQQEIQMNRYQREYTATLPSSGINDLSIYNNNDAFGFSGPYALSLELRSDWLEAEDRKVMLEEKLNNLRDKLRRDSECPEGVVTETAQVSSLKSEMERAEGYSTTYQFNSNQNQREETLDKSVMTSRIQQETQSTENELDALNAHMELLESRFAFASAWMGLDGLEERVKMYGNLLDWIEQQRQLIVAKLSSSPHNHQHGQENTKGYGKRKLRGQTVLEQSIPKKQGRQNKIQLEVANSPNQRVLRSHTAAKRAAEAEPEQDEKISNKRQRSTPRNIAKLAENPKAKESKQKRPTLRSKKAAPKSSSAKSKDKRMTTPKSKAVKRPKDTPRLKALPAKRNSPKRKGKKGKAPTKRQASPKAIIPTTPSNGQTRRITRANKNA